MIIKTYLTETLEGKSDIIFWVAIFCIALLIGILIQVIVLPFLFTSWHAGNGLLLGSDSKGFHEAALKASSEIKEIGWSAWNWHINKRGIVSVTAVLYVLFYPIPLVLLPFNAAIHASMVLVAKKTIELFTENKKTAFYSSLPIAFFPSAMLWYTQIHSDGIQFLGAMLFIYGFLCLASLDYFKINKVRSQMFYVLYSLLGIFFIWLARPHSLIIIQYISVVLFLLFIGYRLTKLFMGEFSGRVLTKAFLLLSIILLIIPFKQTDGSAKYQMTPEIENKLILKAENDLRHEFEWERISFLPRSIDNQLFSIAYLRAITYQNVFGETASGIDYEKTFHSGYDFVAYLPRALQIAFMAPFPKDWFNEGKYESTTFFRRVSALEMTLIYLSLPFLLYGIWIWRKKLELWMLLIFCTMMMLPIVYSVPNVGTIYRYRYGYLMMLVAVGVAAFLEWLRRNKIDESSSGNKNG